MLTQTAKQLSFSQIWRNASKDEKNDIVAISGMAKGHLSSIASGAKQPTHIMQKALAYVLESPVAILFPDGEHAQGKLLRASHMINRNTVGDRV